MDTFYKQVGKNFLTVMNRFSTMEKIKILDTQQSFLSKIRKTIPRVSVATLFMLEAWLIATSSTLVCIPLKCSRLTIMHLLIEYSARILEGFFLMCLGTHPGTHSFLIYCILNYFAESILQILALMRTLKLQQVCTI